MHAFIHVCVCVCVCVRVFVFAYMHLRSFLGEPFCMCVWLCVVGVCVQMNKCMCQYV